MLTLQEHTRYAVSSDKGLVCKNTGNDWRTGLPGYSFTKTPAHAKLYATKAAATKCAQVVDGVVVPVVLKAIEA